MSTQPEQGDRPTTGGSPGDAAAEGAGATPKGNAPQATSDGSSTTGSGRGGAGSPADGSAPDTFAEFLAENRKSQVHLATAIDQTKASLAADLGRQQKLKKQLTDLDRAAADLDRARADGGAVLTEADKTLSAARPVVAELDDEVEKELAQALQAVDEAIDDKRTEVAARRSELTDLQEDRDIAYRTWTERQTAYDARTAALAGLPGAVRQHTVALKALVTELAAATTARNAVKACVLALEAEAAMARSKDALGAAHEAELIGAVRDAGDDLAEARKELTAAEAALGDVQAVVDDLATELREREKNRAADVRKLYDVPSAGTPQSALAAQGA